MLQRETEPMDDVWQEVRNLGIVVPRTGLVVPHALNPEELPLTPASGEIVGITEAQFEYRGPATTVALAWGLKPAGFVDFNNGDNLIPEAWNWQAILRVPETREWSPFSIVNPGGVARVLIPYAGDYTTRGGYAARLNVGTADVWVWLADYDLATQIADEIFVRVEDLLVDESLILVINTDADVVELQAPALPPAEVRNVEARYQFA